MCGQQWKTYSTLSSDNRSRWWIRSVFTCLYKWRWVTLGWPRQMNRTNYQGGQSTVPRPTAMNDLTRLVVLSGITLKRVDLDKCSCSNRMKTSVVSCRISTSHLTITFLFKLHLIFTCLSHAWCVVEMCNVYNLSWLSCNEGHPHPISLHPLHLTRSRRTIQLLHSFTMFSNEKASPPCFSHVCFFNAANAPCKFLTSNAQQIM